MRASSRDFVGYGTTPPTLSWPGGAKLVISLVVNYEEGSERSFAAGDPDQEPLTEWGSYPLPPDIPQPGHGIDVRVRVAGRGLAHPRRACAARRAVDVLRLRGRVRTGTRGR